jgi:hypothetical protein
MDGLGYLAATDAMTPSLAGDGQAFRPACIGGSDQAFRRPRSPAAASAAV